MTVREVIARIGAPLFMSADLRRREARAIRADFQAHFQNARGQRVLAEILRMGGVTQVNSLQGELGQRFEGARRLALMIFQQAGGQDGALADAFIRNSLVITEEKHERAAATAGGGGGERGTAAGARSEPEPEPSDGD